MNKTHPCYNPTIQKNTLSEQYLLPFLFITLVMLIYSNSFSAPFIFDDTETISRNSSSSSFIPEFLTTRMLVDLTFKVNIKLHGNRPVDFRLVNIIIHCIGGLLLYALTQLTLNLARFKKYFSNNSARWIAAISTVLWLVHPVQTESVTYISQRYESLMGLFFLLCMYSFAKGMTSTKPRIWSNICLVSCMTGMMCKEVMVVTPVVILLYDWTFFASSLREIIRNRGKFYIALFMLYFLFILLWIGQLASCLPKGMPITSGLKPWQYLLAQLSILAHYIRIIVFPVNLCLDYAWQPPAYAKDVILPAIFILAIACLSLLSLLRRNPYGFLGTTFFIILAPTSSFVPLEDLAFEHRLYLPIVSVIISLVTGSYIVSKQNYISVPRLAQLNRICLVMLSIISIALLSFMTVKRNATYSNEEVLWKSVVKIRPDNLRARNNLAAVLCEKGKYDEALPHLHYVLQQTEGKIVYIQERKPLMPLSAEAYRFNALVNVGTMCMHKCAYQNAIRYFSEALRIFPYSDIVYAKLCETLRREHRQSLSPAPNGTP